MKSKASSEIIEFREINPEQDYQFFAKTRQQSSYYLDDARNFTEAEVKEFLQDNADNYRIVMQSSIAIGYIRYQYMDVCNKRVCAIGLDIESDFRGKGFAKPIYKLLLQQLLPNDIPVILWVLDFNHRAHKIYQDLGFVEIQKEDFIQKGSQRKCTRIMMEYRHKSV